MNGVFLTPRPRRAGRSMIRDVFDKIAPTALALAIVAYPFAATALVNSLVS